MHLEYFLMLLSHEKILFPSYKVAKHILFPKVSYGNMDMELSYDLKPLYISNIYIVSNSYNATSYYIFKDIIYFYNDRATYLRSLVPLYDYKNGKYYFLGSRVRL